MKIKVFTILLLAAVLRLWDLGNNPPHLSSDEAALGYNAYSILKTGRDEHGEFFPVVFKSFGDWKPGLYVYLAVPSVALFGLSEFAVRLPGAISGVVAVWLLFLVTKELFPSLRNRRLPELAGLFLTVSPWHLQFSRGAWEAGLSLTLILAGTYFFLRSLASRQGHLILSAAWFALTLWAYQGAKLSTLLVIIILLLVYRSKLLDFPRDLLVKAGLLGVVVALPVLVSLLQGKAGRLEVYSIFSYERSPETISEIVEQEGVSVDSWQYYLYHSESLNFLRGILGRWFNHYSGRFFFFEGDWASTRHGVPNAGVILLLDSVFLVAGLMTLARAEGKREVLVVWLWLFLAPLPAALSRDSVHAVRTLNMVVPLSVILALGVVGLFDWVKRRERFAMPAIMVFLFAYIVNYVYYLDQYWVHAPKKNSQQWQYGYKQMVNAVAPLQQKYSEIVVQQDYAQPYIFFLLYQQYDPARYQRIAKEVYLSNQFGDVGLVSRLDNVTFRDINWSADRGMSGKLFVIDLIKVPVEDSSDPTQFKLIDEIKFLNGQTAFRLIEIL